MIWADNSLKPALCNVWGVQQILLEMITLFVLLYYKYNQIKSKVQIILGFNV
jgi:hypothetical protein